MVDTLQPKHHLLHAPCTLNAWNVVSAQQVLVQGREKGSK